MTHQGWVPNDDPADTYLENLRVAVDRRPNTDVVDTVFVTSIEELIQHLNGGGNLPIDDLIVGGHATRRGHWSVSPETGTGTIDWEELDGFVTGGNSPIELPNALIGYVPTVPPDPPAPRVRTFRIKGCSIGRARPFLERLQTALGGNVRVNAPRHEHGISFNGVAGDPNAEYFEWMAYEFVVFQNAAIPTMNALVNAFDARGFTFHDGAAIPRATFVSWLRPFRRRWDRPAFRPLRRNLPLGAAIGGRSTTAGQVAYYMDTPASFPLVPYTIPFGAAAPPATNAGRRASLDAALQADPAFQAGHAWPIYERLGYPDYNAMFNGLVWRFRTGNDPALGNVLRVSGGRFEYELHIPIAVVGADMNPTVAQLMFNHLPGAAPQVPDAIPEAAATNFFFEVVQ